MSSSYGVPTVTSLSALTSGGALPDVPDVPSDAPGLGGAAAGRTPTAQGGLVDFGGLVQSFQAVEPAMNRANGAERAFLQGRGNLLEMVLERAKADTLLSLTSATASKATQAASTLMNLQV